MSTPAFGAPSAPPAVAGSAEPGGAHELKTLILSRHPAIAIETTEEERLDTLLAAVAAETQLTIFDWTITQGLVRRPGAQAVYGTTDPPRMLSAIGELAVDGLYVLKDFDAHLTDPVVSRAFRELLERFAAPAQRSTSCWCPRRSSFRLRSRRWWCATSCGFPAARSTAWRSKR